MTIVAPLGNSEHSSLSTTISMAQAAAYLCVTRKVLLKYRVNWIAVSDEIRELPWQIIYSADNPVETSSVRLSLLVGRFRESRVRNKHKPWFNDD